MQGKEKGYFAELQEDKSVDDTRSEKAVTTLENECNEVLFCSRSELFDWSSSGNRNKLALYCALLYSRSTQRRNHSKKVTTRVSDELMKEAADTDFMQQLADAVNHAASRNVFTADSMRELVLRQAEADNKSDAINTQFVYSIRYLVDYLAGLMLQKKWQVWRSPEGSEFITSDNPVINFIPLAHGPFHPGYGFGKPGVHTAFTLAPDACLVMGVSEGVPGSRRVNAEMVTRMNEAFISICDRYVYSKTLSDGVQSMVQQYAGAFTYGENALLPIGMKLPSVREFLCKRFGVELQST